MLVEYLVLCLAQNEGGQYPSRDSGDERPDYQQPSRMGIERLNAGSCRPALQSSVVLVMLSAGAGHGSRKSGEQT